MALKKFEIIKNIWYNKNVKGFEPSRQDVNVLNEELVH